MIFFGFKDVLATSANHRAPLTGRFDFLLVLYSNRVSKTDCFFELRLAAWCSGYRHSSHEQSYPTSGPVSTGMGDRLWAGIPSRSVTSQLGKLGLA